MKKVQCESCGSVDLYFEDGFLICKSCGTKYAISGLENPNKIYNLLILARRAKEEKDYDKAVKYYEKLLLEDPNSWEAEYNIKLCHMLAANSRQLEPRLEELVESFPTIAKLISYIKNPDERKEVIINITEELTAISKNCYLNSLNLVFLANDVEDKNDEEFYTRLDNFSNLKLYAAFVNQKWPDALNKHIYLNEDIDEDEDLDYLIDLIIDNYKLFVNMMTGIKNELSDKEKAKEWITKTTEVIHKFDPKYKAKNYMKYQE